MLAFQIFRLQYFGDATRGHGALIFMSVLLNMLNARNVMA